MDWTPVKQFFDDPIIRATVFGAVVAFRRDWRAYRLAPQPKEFNWRQFGVSVLEGAAIGLAGALGLDWLL